MSSTAVSKYRTAVKVSTGTTAAKTIISATKADPVVIGSTAHGLAVGTVVVISGVVGMTELNGMAGVITAQATDSFTLGGIDSTNFTTYTSGGSATPQTMTLVENALNFDVASDEAEKFDSTNLQSTKKEYILGLSGEGTVTMPIDIDATGPGQERVRKLVGTDTAVAMQVTRSDSTAFACMVKWSGFGHGFPDKHTGQFTGTISGEAAWYA